MDDGLRMVEAGVCSAWLLPGDPTCAGVARRMFRSAATGLALQPAVVDDGVTMVSELAANTLHVQRENDGHDGHGGLDGHGEHDGNEGQDAQAEHAGHVEQAEYPGQTVPLAQQRPPSRSAPELWLYLRGSGPRRELVCKVFDSFPGWLHGNVPGHGVFHAPADAMSGRGLEVVHELSRGRWGHHLTRSRLAGWDVRGKAVWFAVPASAAEDMLAPPDPRGPAADRDRYAMMAASQAMTELEDGLAARGFGGRMVRADDKRADMAVLSVCSGVTVWCRAGVAWLRAPGLTGRQWAYADLVEVAEQTVQACETLAAKGEQHMLASAARAGALIHA